MNKLILIILDGYGIADDPAVSAIDSANKPFLDKLFADNPGSTLVASGLDVGLPKGQMGNSEVGHLNLGAGRIVYQDITRIDADIESGEFNNNVVLTGSMVAAKDKGSTLHLMGLLSDGGVHSHIDHLKALITLARRSGLEGDRVAVHVFTDGRDTSPTAGIDYMEELEHHMSLENTGRVATIIGRYYAMDRDKRWDRTRIAYEALVRGTGEAEEIATLALRKMYNNETTDEFVQPILVGSERQIRSSRVRDGDEIIFFNFRADRARQICAALAVSDFDGFHREPVDVRLATFTSYDKTFDFPVAFPKGDLSSTMGEVMESSGLKQLRAAETEKYPHVTYFFSGGREEKFEGEERILVASPKVATYDLQPEMSAPELSMKVAAAIAKEEFDFILLNFANPDMVGHTGNFDAAVQAIEALDACVRRVIDAAEQHGYTVQVIADHGNADKMLNEDGSPHTAHTTALVPHIVIRTPKVASIQHGRLCDVVPTALRLMGVTQPAQMTGMPLVELP